MHLLPRHWMTLFFLLSSAIISTTLLLPGVAGDDDVTTSSSSNKENNNDDDDEDEYTEPPSIAYEQFAKNADKESGFKESSPVCGDFYQLAPRTADGNILSLEILRGKLTLVVNIASKYGVQDPTYHDLVRLQSAFGPTKLFNVIVFPCFQFNDGGTAASVLDIRQFLQEAYGANFAFFETVHCLGPAASDVFRFLSHEAKTKAPLWNFWKFLVGPDGHLLSVMSSTQSAAGLHARIKLAIDELLLEKRVEL